MSNIPNNRAAQALLHAIDSGTKPETLDRVYDLLKLMGLILGHSALLAVASDPNAEPSERVSAAKALISVKESPEDIAERLKRAPFTDLSVDQLKGMIRKIEAGEDITFITKEPDNGNRSPSK